MREIINRVYREKAIYYIEIIDALAHRDIKFILLNTLVADDSPGDLDIMISPNDYSLCEQSLKDCKLKYYTRYQTNQYLWNKYITDIGFIQAHIYCGVWFNNTCYYKLPIVNEALQRDYVFNLYVFLLESYYKNKLRIEQYNEYCRHVDVNNIFSLFVGINSEGANICIQMIDAYNNKTLPHKVFDHNIIYKLWHKLIRVFHNQDVEVLFLGVDGAGKSTLVEEVKKVFIKGGIYPQVVYMGLRTSVFSRHETSTSQYTPSKNSDKEDVLEPLPFTFARFMKVCCCWVEYNIKYFLNIRLLKNTANTVYLIDRCYIDLLMFYQNGFVKKLFTSLSFHPDKVIMITGEEKVLYNRKKEMSEKRYSWLYSFYLSITDLYKVHYADRMLVVDTTLNDIDTCKRTISNFIAKD